MHMRAHEGIYNSLYLRYEPVTGMLCIFLSLEHEQYCTVQEIVQRFARSHAVCSAALRLKTEFS